MSKEPCNDLIWNGKRKHGLPCPSSWDLAGSQRGSTGCLGIVWQQTESNRRITFLAVLLLLMTNGLLVCCKKLLIASFARNSFFCRVFFFFLSSYSLPSLFSHCKPELLPCWQTVYLALTIKAALERFVFKESVRCVSEDLSSWSWCLVEFRLLLLNKLAFSWILRRPQTSSAGKSGCCRKL